MRYPPSLLFTPRASRVYRSTAVFITMLLIAACAYSMPLNGEFPSEKILCVAMALLISIGLLRDAWRPPRGSLHYTQGQWHWVQGDQQTAGTCVLHLDLQTYMLVSFTAHCAQEKLFQTTKQWFHLEARHVDHAAIAADAGQWGALRRAIYAPMAPADEAVVA